ncbi:MAG: DinB family protein [Chloroflexia bacterium]|nr:DinB family protein [Chloroflexia bacterium]MDQ3514641.1 DinB family protein [Chloroflexota bacterium]
MEQGATDLIAAVEGLTDEQWATICPDEQRSVGVLVHHVGAAYPEEADITTALAREGGVPGLTWEAVNQGNQDEAESHEQVDKASALAQVRENVATAATVVRGLTDEQLDRVALTDLHWEAPLTVQFFVEHHPIAHPYMHLEGIRAALGLNG